MPCCLCPQGHCTTPLANPCHCLAAGLCHARMLCCQRPSRRRQTDRQRQAHAEAESQRSSPASLLLRQPARTCINVTTRAVTADSYLTSPRRRLEWCQPPGLLFPYPHRPAQQLQGTVSKLSLVEDSGPKAALTLPSPTHVPSLAPLHPQGMGRRARDKHGKSRTITPELVPVRQRANAPRVLPLAAIPHTGTAYPLSISASLQLGAPSGCVHFDKKSRRGQVRDCKYLACCSRLIAGSWDQAFPRNCTVALQDRTVTTLQHTSAFKCRTLQSYRTDFAFNSLRL